jgi:hypothetical protein
MVPTVLKCAFSVCGWLLDQSGDDEELVLRQYFKRVQAIQVDFDHSPP